MSNAYCERADQVKAKAEGAWLQLLISGLVIYILAAGVGLVLITFSDGTRQVFGNLRRSILQYMPQSSKPHYPVIQPPAEIETPAPRKPAPRPARMRPIAMPAKGSFGVQIINATQPESPVHDNPAVMTVSINDEQPVQTAKAPSRPSSGPAQ